MENEHPINKMMETALDRLKSMIGSDTIIGTPITLEPGVTAVPVSKISFGFATGGSDFQRKENKTMFGGGVGGGMTVTPVAFLVSTKDGVRLLKLDLSGSAAESIINTVPELIDRVVAMTKSKKDENEKL